MTQQLKDQFLKMVDLQAQTNRMMHGDNERSLQEWAMIAMEHIGHLSGAVLECDRARAEKEILHVAAPLLELFCAVKKAGA